MLACVGTRPEVIKLAPVIIELRRRGDTVFLASTGQHREMLDQALSAFALTPDVDLGLMRYDQSLAELTGRAVPALDDVICAVQPRVALVQGDTTTAFCGALASFYRGVAVAHVEAGLRTGALENPFPEEANRRLIGQLSAWHFCPTETGRRNLLREGVQAHAIHVTGNTVVDAALSAAARIGRPSREPDGPRRVLVTIHRRESQGQLQREIAAAVAKLADRQDIHIVFPVHLSPAVRASVLPVLEAHPNVTLSDPLGYTELIAELCRADLVLSDSGGLQEEAPAFDVPVLVLRDTTERPEGIEAGCSVICGTDPARILAMTNALLDDDGLYARMAAAPNPYGDGLASRRIADVLLPVEDTPPPWTRTTGGLIAELPDAETAPHDGEPHTSMPA